MHATPSPTGNFPTAFIVVIIFSLDSSHDDIRAIASTTILTFVDLLLVEHGDCHSAPSIDISSILNTLWDILLVLDDLACSTSSVIELLCRIVTKLPQTRVDPPSAPPQITSDHSNFLSRIPRLFPFFRHTSVEVRRSVLSAVDALMPQLMDAVLMQTGECGKSASVDSLSSLFIPILVQLNCFFYLEEHETLVELAAATWMKLWRLFRDALTDPCITSDGGQTFASSKSAITFLHSLVEEMMSKYLMGWCQALMTMLGNAVDLKFLFVERSKLSASDAAVLCQDAQVVSRLQIVHSRHLATKCLSTVLVTLLLCLDVCSRRGGGSVETRDLTRRFCVWNETILAQLLEISVHCPRGASQRFGTFLIIEWSKHVRYLVDHFSHGASSPLLQAPLRLDALAIQIFHPPLLRYKKLVEGLVLADEDDAQWMRFSECFGATNRLHAECIALLNTFISETQVSDRISVATSALFPPPIVLPPLPTVQSGIFSIQHAQTIVGQWIPQLLESHLKPCLHLLISLIPPSDSARLRKEQERQDLVMKCVGLFETKINELQRDCSRENESVARVVCGVHACAAVELGAFLFDREMAASAMFHGEFSVNRRLLTNKNSTTAPPPLKLSPIIKALMNVLKTEPCVVLQRECASALADLISTLLQEENTSCGLETGAKVAAKVVKNLTLYLCANPFAPLLAHIPPPALSSQRNGDTKSQQILPHAATSISPPWYDDDGILTLLTTSAHSTSAHSTSSKSPPSPSINSTFSDNTSEGVASHHPVVEVFFQTDEEWHQCAQMGAKMALELLSCKFQHRLLHFIPTLLPNLTRNILGALDDAFNSLAAPPHGR